MNINEIKKAIIEAGSYQEKNVWYSMWKKRSYNAKKQSNLDVDICILAEKLGVTVGKVNSAVTELYRQYNKGVTT
jgi:allantoicase